MVSRVIIENAAMKPLAPLVVWIPMLDADELPGADEASARFRGLPQFWDGGQKLGREVGRSVGAPEWVAWDVYLFYPPGAAWGESGLPAPAAALAQTGGGVVATKGALPPAGDQAGVPEPLAGRVDVVGDPAHLDALLAQVAERFAGGGR